MAENVSNKETSFSAGDDEMLAELIRSGGRRESPPPEHYNKVFAAAKQSLAAKRSQVQTRQRSRFALAASLCVAVIGGLLWLSPASDPLNVRFTRVVGEAEWRASAEKNWLPVASAGAIIASGSELRTLAGSGMSLNIGKLSLRIADNTTLTLSSPKDIYLDGGKIYLDTGQENGSSITVTTPTAVATDIGTQFEVRFIERAYRLRVRSGEVQLAADTAQVSGSAGEEFSIDENGAVERSEIAADDPDWVWAEELAPAPGIEGEPLKLLLDWVARETGREVVFANPIVELKSKQTIMHGTVDNLAPLQALEVVLATTDFRALRTEEGKILIKAISPTD